MGSSVAVLAKEQDRSHLVVVSKYRSREADHSFQLQ